MKRLELPTNFNNTLKVLPFILGIIIFWATANVLWATLGFVISLALIAKNKLQFLPLILGIIGFWMTGRWVWLLLGLVITVSIPIIKILYQRFTILPYYFLYLWYINRGKLEKALELTNKAVATTPDNYTAHYLRTTVYCRQQEYAKMELDARKLTELNPDYWSGYTLLGESLYFQEHFQEAREALEKALDSTPKKGMHHCYLGQIHYRLQEFAQAVHHLRLTTTFKIKKESLLTAYYHLGHSLEGLGEHQEAQTAFEQMKHYRNGLKKLKKAYNNWSDDNPVVSLMKEEIKDIEQLLVTDT